MAMNRPARARKGPWMLSDSDMSTLPAGVTRYRTAVPIKESFKSPKEETREYSRLQKGILEVNRHEGMRLSIDVMSSG